MNLKTKLRLRWMIFKAKIRGRNVTILVFTKDPKDEYIIKQYQEKYKFYNLGWIYRFKGDGYDEIPKKIKWRGKWVMK